MNKTGWLFPGQASQKVGMGLDLYQNSNLARKYFEISKEIMGFDITSVIFEGPESKLKKTEYTQPAIYIVSVILGYLLLEKGIKPYALAGHSLGEYSALAIAGAFDFNEGLELVKVRSRSMANAGLIHDGKMAAIIGMNKKNIESICSSYKGKGIVVTANYNSPDQIIISGTPDAIEWTMNLAKDSGARMTIELNVSGAFHSPLMSPAREELAEYLNSLEISDACFPLYTNVDAKPITKNHEIKDSLMRQLENPVLWYKSIQNMKTDGVSSFIEVGPGKVLQGLNKRIDKSLNTNGINTMNKLEKFIV